MTTKIKRDLQTSFSGKFESWELLFQKQNKARHWVWNLCQAEDLSSMKQQESQIINILIKLSY